MEDVSGMELGWFFQQWVELPGVPKLTVRSAWEDGAARARALLGWRPRIPWETTLRDVLDDYRRRS